MPDNYPRYLSKNKRILHYAIMIVLLIVGSNLSAVGIFNGTDGFYFTVAGHHIYYGQIFPIIIPGLIGFIPSMLFTLTIFLHSMFADLEASYFNCAILITVLLSYYFAKKKAYSNLRLALIATVTLSFSEGPLWYLMSLLVNIGKTFSLYDLLYCWVTVLPETIVSIIFLGLLYNKAPDSVKEVFYTSHFYTQRYIDQYGDVSKQHYSKLAGRVNIVIAIGVVTLAAFDVGIVVLVYNLYLTGLTVRYLDDVQRNPYILRVLFMSINLFVPGVSLCDYVMQKTVVYPIERIAMYMKSYTTTSDEKKEEFVNSISSVKPFHKDEIRDLYDSLGFLLNEINMYINRIKEEKRLKDDLAVANAANDAKSAFLSSMSHEIRTPINAVLGMDEMIIRETKEPDTLKHAEDIQSAGKILLALVNDILDFSKIEANKMEIQPVEYDLGVLVNDLYNMINEKAQKKGLTLKIEVAPGIPSVLFGDEIRIKQCILNLLNNALKYTERGHVELEINYTRQSDKLICMHVAIDDTGIGIKEEDYSKLFAPFERLEEDKNRTIEGTGLGMSIVNNLLGMMDSKLRLETSYGVGSRFEFDLLQKVVDWQPIGDIWEHIKEIPVKSSSYHEMFHAPSARILVIDDTEVNLTVVKELLKKTQIIIDTALSGKEGLGLVAGNEYDLIFIDHRMPEMDGIQTLHLMKEMDSNMSKDTPCIALTANAISGARREYISEGFTDYLAKPVTGIELEQMLLKYLPQSKIEIFEETEATAAREEDNFLEKIALYAEDRIDVGEALKNCSSEEILKKVLNDYLIAIDEKSELIEKHLREGNINDYTVMVHALKSSSRLIGAMELSNLAAQLENDGNNRNIDELNKLTPRLLEMYRSLKPIIENIFSTSETVEKEELDRGGLNEALSSIREFVEVFDFDSADAVIGMMDDYKMPKDFEEDYRRIKELLTAVDRDKLLEILPTSDS